MYLTAFFLTRLRMYMSSSSQRAVAVYSLLLSVTKSTTSGLRIGAHSSWYGVKAGSSELTTTCTRVHSLAPLSRTSTSSPSLACFTDVICSVSCDSCRMRELDST